ncbi:MAG TPA: STAS domain-containing protein [Pelomicrobium sp.]|nr:STAS domain-containing protein [Pelomicrobium sp.]
MTVRMSVHDNPNKPVVIEYTGHIDSRSEQESLVVFDRIHHVWWRDLVVVLRDLQFLDGRGIELLLYFHDRAGRCSLRFIHCAPRVMRTVDAIGLRRYFEITVDDDMEATPAPARLPALDRRAS